MFILFRTRKLWIVKRQNTKNVNQKETVCAAQKRKRKRKMTAQNLPAQRTVKVTLE